MDSTSLSFLDRFRSGKLQAKDQQHIQELYCPLIRQWIARLSGLNSDSSEADDLVQDVLEVLVREVPTFERRHSGAFRSYLRDITLHRIWNFRKAQKKYPVVGTEASENALAQFADPNSDLAQAWDRDHQQHLTSKMLAMAQPDFEAKTWEAFTRCTLLAIPVQRVAVELDMTPGAVIQAKSRVLHRLRQIRHFFLE